MKTIKTITAILLLTISTGAFKTVKADELPKTGRLQKNITVNPEDINNRDIESLKNLPATAPTLPSLNAEDLDLDEIEKLKTIGNKLPLAINPEDINSKEIEALKYVAF
ncbi:hypothetical protein [Rubrolithibacter danxiaensis]|uniref:hypothetical protein n=1 Tax=Rubrolithibacter danxiaensis TaxID=3390805 RepID=UPI003BF7F754